jgi:hypothetical protein
MENMIEKPYLSMIVTSRNDDYGGSGLQCTQISINGRLEQLEKYKIESELILVDWNPPSDRPLLKDVLKWPDNLAYCNIRIIVVPSTIHHRFEHSEKTEMNVIGAINCAVRRARGQFILPGHIDFLYPDEFMAFIASKQLKKNERYRVNRCDVNRSVIKYSNLEEQLDYCKNNIIKNYMPDPKEAHKKKWIGKKFPILHTVACGDCQLMSRENWHLLRGYRDADIPSAYADSLLSYASYAAGIKEVVLYPPICIYHIDHADKFDNRIKTNYLPFEKFFSFSFMPAAFNNKLIGLYRRCLLMIGYEI